MECPFLDELRQASTTKAEVEQKEDQSDPLIPKRVTESAFQKKMQ